MHPTAMDNGRLFFERYVADATGKTIVDVGAQSVNGSLRDACPLGARYLGVDFAAGEGVDIVLDDPYRLPFETSSVDVVVSSSCFEHIEFFWLMFNEILRVLKPSGLFYMNAPSNGEFHRYPVDCWRFYPDSGQALVNWGARTGYRPVLLESFTTRQRLDVWNDYVVIFLKDQSRIADHPDRILDRIDNYTNGQIHGRAGFLRPQTESEDLAKLQKLTGSLKPTE
jgi:SAM-dependent methyltransferase